MELKIKSKHNIIGRGEIFVISLKENELKNSTVLVGETFTHDSVLYEIRKLECFRQGNKLGDSVGLVSRKILSDEENK